MSEPKTPTSATDPADDETLTRQSSSRPRAEADDLREAKQIGRFPILGTIGAGGMGRVYAAYDPKLDRKIALKVLRGKHSGSATQRLLREAQALARLQHPNVVAVHDVGVDRGRVFMAMEFVEGDTLKGWITEREPGDAGRFEAVSRLLLAAGRGLEAAHRAGLIHRDFKPHNVLCGSDGQAKVVDFGLARSDETIDSSELIQSGAQSGGSPVVTVDEKLTRTGAVVGTPAYMAPEQFAGRELDARADIFGFCVTAWEAIFGQRPFAAPSAAALLVAIKDGQIQRSDAEAAGVPEWVEPLLRRGLAARPASRYRSIAELLEAWEAKLDPAPSIRRSLLAVAGVGAIAIIAAASIAAIVSPDTRACEVEGPGVGPQLQAYAEGWSRARADACEDTRVRHEQTEALMELRFACLDDRRRDLVALANAEPGARARRATGELRELDLCADADYVLARPRAPTDETAAKLDEAVRVQLAAAKVADIATAGEILASVAPDVAAAKHPSLAAKFALVNARVQRDRGEFDEAAGSLGEAYLLGREAADAYVAAASALEMLELLSQDQGAHDSAARWAMVARLEAEREGDRSLLARVYAATGLMHQLAVLSKRS